MKLTLMNLSDRCRTEADAYELLEELRWHGTPVCPHCGNEKAYFLTPKNGETRATGLKKTMSPRRVWKCAKCRKQFSVLTGTIFHGTKIPLRVWFQVLSQMSSAKNGMSAREVARMAEITEESAWHMCHRIREAMKREPVAGLLSGVVTADETFIGGKEKNKHKQGKPRTAGKRGGHGPQDGKTAVFSLVDRDTGEVRSHVVADVTGATLRKVIVDHVDMANTTLHTDAAKQYRPVGQEFAEHAWVDHANNEYVRGTVSTNQAESFFAQLKRSIDGTHHNVSVEHLPRYLAEFDFRWSTRKMTDSARMETIIENSGGRRLSYEPLRREK